MREVTTDVMNEIMDRIEAVDYPDVTEWNANPAKIFIDDKQIVFECHDVVDAERVLYSIMAVISGG